MTTLPQSRIGGQSPQTPTVACVGISGARYTLRLYQLRTRFKVGLPGVYGFFGPAANGVRDVYYFGETECFDGRVGAGCDAHHKWPRVVKSPVTHIGVLIVGGGKTARCNVERDLVQAYNPPFND